MPAVTAHNAVGDSRTLSAGYLLFVRVAMVFAAGACLCLWLGGRSLLQHWAGAGVFPGYSTFGIQLALLFIQVLVAPGDAILMGTSRHYVYARLAVLEGVLNLALSLWWVRIWGLPGVIAGTVAARLLTNGWYIPLAATRVTGLGVRNFVRGVARTAAASLVAAGAVAFSLAPWGMSAAAGAIGVACAAGLAFLIVSLGLGLTRTERLWALQKIIGLRAALGWRAAERAA